MAVSPERSHKSPAPARTGDQILTSLKQLEQFSKKLRKKLKLRFDLAAWQAKLVQKILDGHDVIFVAGTGRGKSIIWEAVAAMKEGKVVVVIVPLKSMQMDLVGSSLYEVQCCLES